MKRQQDDFGYFHMSLVDGKFIAFAPFMDQKSPPAGKALVAAADGPVVMRLLAMRRSDGLRMIHLILSWEQICPSHLLANALADQRSDVPRSTGCDAHWIERSGCERTCECRFGARGCGKDAADKASATAAFMAAFLCWLVHL